MYTYVQQNVDLCAFRGKLSSKCADQKTETEEERPSAGPNTPLLLNLLAAYEKDPKDEKLLDDSGLGLAMFMSLVPHFEGNYLPIIELDCRGSFITHEPVHCIVGEIKTTLTQETYKKALSQGKRNLSVLRHAFGLAHPDIKRPISAFNLFIFVPVGPHVPLERMSTQDAVFVERIVRL
jgi:hypothetical protein